MSQYQQHASSIASRSSKLSQSSWRPTDAQRARSQQTSQVTVTPDMLVRAKPISQNKFPEGTIIIAPHIETCYDENEPKVTPSSAGALCTKERFMIVLARWSNHMIALPMFSFKKKGINHFSLAEKKEFVGLKTRGDTNYENQGLYQPLEIRHCDQKLWATSHVRLTAPVVLRYNSRVKVKGKIEIDSFLRMLDLHNKVWEERLDGLRKESMGLGVLAE